MLLLQQMRYNALLELDEDEMLVGDAFSMHKFIKWGFDALANFDEEDLQVLEVVDCWRTIQHRKITTNEDKYVELQELITTKQIKKVLFNEAGIAMYWEVKFYIVKFERGEMSKTCYIEMSKVDIWRIIEELTKVNRSKLN